MTPENSNAVAKASNWFPQMHWHQWSCWSDPVQTGNTGHKQQWRVCTVCNKADFRTLFWDKQSQLDAVLNAIKALRAKGVA